MSATIQLISTDFDGTLHAEFENPPVPHDLQALLGALQQQGARWVINTGRDLSSVMEALARARLSVKPDFLVTVEREIYCHEGTRYAPLEEWNLACHRAHQALFRRIEADIPRLFDWVNKRFTATVYSDPWSPFCLMAESLEDTDLIQAFLEDYCRSVPHLTVVRNDVYARFSHANYDKGSTLAEIARRLDVRARGTFAAGDHLNDLPMLSAAVAGLVAAPDNAVPQVKEAVRGRNGYVSHQPWGHGVARALEHFLGAT
jgi:hypothetical protein